MAPQAKIDFDLDGPYAGLHTIALMCRLDVESRSALVAKLGLCVHEFVRTDLQTFLTGVLLALRNGLPTSDDLDDIIASCARDNNHQKYLWELVEKLAAPAVGKASNVRLELRFWKSAIIAFRAGYFEKLLTDQVWDGVVEPAGGKAALIDSPSGEALVNEVFQCVTGKAMIAGLSLYLAAALTDLHPDLSCSLDNTYRIIKGFHQTFHTRPDHAKKQLPRWRLVVALWAGLLAEADCWTEDTLLDLDRLHDVFYEVAYDTARRARLYSYAKWFTDVFVPGYGHKQASGIDRLRSQMLALPDTIPAVRPPLRPLPATATKHAKRVA